MEYTHDLAGSSVVNTDWVLQIFRQMWNCCTSVVLLFHIIKFCECVLEHAFLRSGRRKLSQMGCILSWFTDQAKRSKAETNQGCTKTLSVNCPLRTTTSFLTVPQIFSVLNMRRWKYVWEVETDPLVLKPATRRSVRSASGFDFFNPETKLDVRHRSQCEGDGSKKKFSAFAGI